MVLLKAQGANRIRQLRAVLDFGEMREQRLVEFVDLGLEVSEDKDDVLSPEHNIVAPQVIHKQEEVREEEGQIVSADVLWTHRLDSHD